MIAVATALALLSGLFPTSTREVQVQRYSAAKGWMLLMRDDSFTGAKTCVLRGRNMSYSGGIVMFRFASSVDTANALYRIDQALPASVGLVATEAAGLGARFRSGNVKNPSNGRVYIPAKYLSAAQSVTIRPNSAKPSKVFDLTTLGEALAVAKAQGCEGI